MDSSGVGRPAVFDRCRCRSHCRSARRPSRQACTFRWRSATAATSTHGAGTASANSDSPMATIAYRPARIPDAVARACRSPRDRRTRPRWPPARSTDGAATRTASSAPPRRNSGDRRRCLPPPLRREVAMSETAAQRTFAPRFPAARRHRHRRSRGSAGRFELRRRAGTSSTSGPTRRSSSRWTSNP